jgi:DNA-binding winged helix-turn-helix (wHTH) protein/TolB-like protein/Tfp pilus assembly protein PilF
MSNRPQQRYEFGPFQLDIAERSLLREGRPVALTPKVFDLLEVLVRNSGHLVEKDELIKQVWPDSFVEEGNLNRNVSILRKVLGDDSGQPYIETVPKRGYRFAAVVREITTNGSQVIDTESNTAHAEAKGPDVVLAAPRGVLPARRWQILAGLAVLSLAIVIYVLTRTDATATPPEIKSIAVLPLENLSGDPAQDSFADGMTDALTSSLAQMRALRVTFIGSTMSFKGSKKTLPEMAQDLNVDALVLGSLQRENGRVKIMVQLIHGPTGAILWARPYEREQTDVLKLQAEVTRAIADEIRIQVTPEERARLASAPTVNPAALDQYTKGRVYLWNYNTDDFKQAMDYFERAIQIDPNYAAAYAGLSHASYGWGQQRLASKEVEQSVRANAQKALELDDRLAVAHVAQGQIKIHYDWDWQGGEDSFRRALELDPNSLDAHFMYAFLLQALERFPEAIREMKIAEQLDPLSAHVQSSLGRILLWAGKTNEAKQRLERAMQMAPRSALIHNRLADVYIEMGRYSEALELLDRRLVLRGNRPDNPPFLARLVPVYARMGKLSEVERILKDIPPNVDSVLMAIAYVALGDNDAAFRVLSKMVEERKGNIFIKADPGLDPLHSDPRWLDLMRRMNFHVEP